jgi:hypothetical protein
MPEEEEPATEWAKAKGHIRGQIPEIPFLHWFGGTRQIQRCGARILVSDDGKTGFGVALPTVPTGTYASQCMTYQNGTMSLLPTPGFSECLPERSEREREHEHEHRLRDRSTGGFPGFAGPRK